MKRNQKEEKFLQEIAAIEMAMKDPTIGIAAWTELARKRGELQTKWYLYEQDEKEKMLLQKALEEAYEKEKKAENLETNMEPFNSLEQ